MKLFFGAVFLALVSTAHALKVPNFAAASLVLGQSTFTTADSPNPPTASSLAEPAAVVIDAATGKVFVADTGNNRVLRFANAAALTSGAAAEVVFGQGDFTSSSVAAPPTASSLDSPTGLWIDPAGRLWVADTDNNRVVMHPNAATVATNGPAAALVFGQPDLQTKNPDPAQPGAATLSSPHGVCVDSAGRLWVADTGNNRVLRFGTVSPDVPAAGKPSGSDADGLLGQSQFTNSSPGTSNQQLSGPTGVTVDAAGTLWIADRANNRVLGYPSAGTVSNGTNASRILGQPDFNGSVSPGTTDRTMNGPAGVFADADNNLWVLDQNNNRALRFANRTSIENGRPAAAVVGQPNFTSNATGLTSRQLDAPFLGIFVETNRRLWLSDRDHHRVLRFSPLDDESPVVKITGKAKRSTARASIVIRGTVRDDVGVTRVTLKGKKAKLNFSKTRWSRRVALKPGRNALNAQAFDAAGHRSKKARVVVIRR